MILGVRSTRVQNRVPGTEIQTTDSHVLYDTSIVILSVSMDFQSIFQLLLGNGTTKAVVGAWNGVSDVHQYEVHVSVPIAVPVPSHRLFTRAEQ